MHRLNLVLQLACAFACAHYLIVGAPYWFVVFAVSDVLVGSLTHAWRAARALGGEKS